MREHTCCFTGHREMTHEQRKIVAERLYRTVEGLICSGMRYFGTGGALGFDTMAAECVLTLRERYPYIKLILVLPCVSQTKGWLEEDVRTYEEIKCRADKTVYTSQEYTRDCMFKRNRHLVDHSSICVAYLKERKGGTAYTVKYAMQKGLQVINLADP